jgi:hypothetical protein
MRTLLSILGRRERHIEGRATLTVAPMAQLDLTFQDRMGCSSGLPMVRHVFAAAASEWSAARAGRAVRRASNLRLPDIAAATSIRRRAQGVGDGGKPKRELAGSRRRIGRPNAKQLGIF